MKASYLTLASLIALAAVGCDVPPFEVDPNFAQNDASLTEEGGTDADAADVVDTAPPGDGACATNLDCAGRLDAPFCDVTSGRCVACLTSDRCKKGEWCNAGECVKGCRDDSDCIGAKPGDPVGSGDAGKADADAAAATKMTCNATLHLCVGCTADADCNPGYLCSISGSGGDAGADATSTDATADAGNGGVCVPGCNPEHACPTGLDCCGGACISTKADLNNCGACGKVCDTLAHTTVKCAEGACKIASCDLGWADCTGGDTDGCETDIFTKVETCGGCGTPCTVANGTGKCEGGACKVASCSTGFDDCDGVASNGCEQQLNTLTHCGKCGQGCSVPNATGNCGDGNCRIGACNTGWKDCDGIPATGCEINTATNPNNCGTCGTVCPSTGGTPECAAGVCKYSTCAAGFGNCDGVTDCSKKITDDVNNCGACGRTCTFANATPQCIGTSCSIVSCNTGFGNCNGITTDGCETSLDSVTNCGTCGGTCSRTNATATCGTGACKIGTCSPNFGNCDGIDDNGCEKSLTSDPANCGGCGSVCTVPNATAACTASTCVVGTCNAGYANCDGDATSNGCERNLSAALNTCETAIALVDATSSPDVCGTKTTETTTAVTTFGKRFYKLHLLRCDSGPCKATDPMRARFTVTAPAGMTFSLKVYNAGTTSCLGALVGEQTTTAGGTASVTYTDATCTDPKDLIVEVSYVSGTGCGVASLSATGAYFPL